MFFFKSDKNGAEMTSAGRNEVQLCYRGSRSQSTAYKFNPNMWLPVHECVFIVLYFCVENVT